MIQDNYKIELLAPAGDYESLVAAVENGADAVYLGGKLFNARQFASNFDIDKLKDAIYYAHVRGVKIYLTMNTLISDNELPEAYNFTKEAYVAGIDGVIVQDLGLAKLLKETLPQINLHASTQATIYNTQGAKILQELEFKRVVLARELSFEEIKEITDNTSLETEVFIHGALCISYSGQCLMSSIIGGRSANRGKCAQPCRLKYELYNNENITNAIKTDEGYLISPKDLCTLNMLNDIIGTGVKSLKIEGRMKSPEYVAVVVSIYRKYIDMIYSNPNIRDVQISDSDMHDLKQVFNRGGFCEGYLKGKFSKQSISIEKPKNWGICIGNVINYDKITKLATIKLTKQLSLGDGVEIFNRADENPSTIISYMSQNGKNIRLAEAGSVLDIGEFTGDITKGNAVYKTSDKNLNDKARTTFSGAFIKRIRLNCEIQITLNKYPTITVWDDDGKTATAVSSELPQVAINKPISKERIIDQINKTGSTPFEFSNINISVDDNITIPISSINDLRRQVLEDIQDKRAMISKRDISINDKDYSGIKNSLFKYHNKTYTNQYKEISLFFYYWTNQIDLLDNIKDITIYVPYKALIESKNQDTLLKFKKNNVKIFGWIPQVIRWNYSKLINNTYNNVKSLIDGVMIGNIGCIDLFKDTKLVMDYTCNSFNSITLLQLKQLGVEQATLSPELSFKQIENLERIEGLKKEIIAYGRLALMTCEYCPAANKKCKSGCGNNKFSLKDRKGIHFPLICDNIDCRINILNSKVLLIAESLDKIRLRNFDVCRLNISDETANEIVELVELHRSIINNNGILEERFTSLLETLKNKGFTKGHYFKGV